MASELFGKSFDHYQVTPHPYDPTQGYVVVSPKRVGGRRILIRQCNRYWGDGPFIAAYNAVLNGCLDFFSLFDHPSLPCILDRGTFRGYPSFTVPYSESVMLWHIPKNNLPIEVVKHIMLCIFDALEHFYSRLPSAEEINLLCWDHIERPFFDVDMTGCISVMYPEPLHLFELTYQRLYNLPKIPRLTPKLYHPPETIRHHENSKEISDIYMVGSFFWTFLTGELFAAGGSDFDMWRRVLRGEFPAPSALREDVLPDMDALCMSMIEKDPQARCQSFAAARDALLAVNVSQDVGREMLARMAQAEYAQFCKPHAARPPQVIQNPQPPVSTQPWWSRWWSHLRKA